MSNSRKGITVKISNWVQQIKNLFFNAASGQEDRPLTYEEYRSRQEFSNLKVRVNRGNNGKEPGASTMAINAPKVGPSPVRNAKVLALELEPVF